MNRFRSIFCIILLSLLFCPGCGPGTTKVNGFVRQNGQGLKDIVVLLQPISDAVELPETAFGVTDAQGHFSLSLINSKKSRVVPGEYFVIINWRDPHPKPENEPQNKCPYDIPASAKNGTRHLQIEKKNIQTIEFELDDFKE